MGISLPSPVPIILLKVWDLPREEAEEWRNVTKRSHVVILRRVGLVSSLCRFDWVYFVVHTVLIQWGKDSLSVG